MKKVLLLPCLLIISTIVYAQGGLPGDDVADVPIDGGASFVAAAAIAYGAKKLKQRKNKLSDK